MGTTHHPHTEVVVIVVWIVVVAIRAGGVVLIVIERAAPQHLSGRLADRSQQQEYNSKSRQTDSASRRDSGGFPQTPLEAFASLT